MRIQFAQVQGRGAIDDFDVHITNLANQLEVLDNVYTEPEIMWKFLQATPLRYSQIVMASKTLLDLGTLSN